MIQTILPAIITIFGNVIFYLLIKGKIDKSIEKNKIAYSGIFREKVNIYRKLLKKTYVIKKKLNRFQNFGAKEDGNELMQDINKYIQFYLINQPFLSEEMLLDLNEIRAEFQDVFEKSFKHISNDNPENLAGFFQAGNKLKSDNPFKEIEKRIITEMRRDLKVAEFE